LPLKNAYETSGARETHMTRVLCRIESEGAVGWGESVAGELPWYSGETWGTVLYALETFILPELFKADLASADDVDRKLAWVGELASAKRVHDVCASRDIPVWCGGMLEMGIGRAHNVHLASLPNFRVPGDVSASARYFATEIIGEPFTVEKDGTMKVPTKPGI